MISLAESIDNGDKSNLLIRDENVLQSSIPHCLNWLRHLMASIDGYEFLCLKGGIGYNDVIASENSSFHPALIHFMHSFSKLGSLDVSSSASNMKRLRMYIADTSRKVLQFIEKLIIAENSSMIVPDDTCELFKHVSILF
jgi:hypothetical protein